MNNILLNEYREDSEFKNFPDLDIKLNSYYDRLHHTVDLNFRQTSPRYKLETGYKIGFRDIFYYIDMLYDGNTNTVIDVGCGECIWKKWFPNIIGFDPTPSEFSTADFVDYFDEDFSKGHYENWYSGMALNSLHFITWKDIEYQIKLAMNIVQKRFLFTFNPLAMKDVPFKTMSEQVKEFHSILTTLDYNIMMFDAPLLRGISEQDLNQWSAINGSIRFILEK